MDDGDFRDLQERASVIADLASQVGWLFLTDRARATIMMKQERILLSRCLSFETYKADCAWVEGALWVLSLPQAVKNELHLELETRAEAVEEEEDDTPEEAA